MKPNTPHQPHKHLRSIGPIAFLLTVAALAAFSLGVLATSPASATSGAGSRPVLAPGFNLSQPITPVATIAPGDVVTTSQPSPAVSVEPTPFNPDVPPAEQTRVAPLPVRTDEAGNPVATVPRAVPSTAPGNNPGDNPGNTGNNPAVPPGAQPGTSGGDFPWWPIVLVGAAALAGAGFMLMRRTPAQATATRPTVRNADTTSTTTLVEPNAVTTASARATTAAPPITVTTATVAPTFTTVDDAPAPADVACPNCGTINGPGENFCHECGEDLRPVRASALAPAAGVAAASAPAAALPADVDIDTLPYLETLDRTDEQLEYVLSRPRVLIGTAPGNDIVINADFKGSASVSPVHAELRRDEEGYVLRDRESEGGTYLNDARISEGVLADGDTMRLGEVRFVFHVPEAE